MKVNYGINKELEASADEFEGPPSTAFSMHSAYHALC
jgi:hypothetical protein